MEYKRLICTTGILFLFVGGALAVAPTILEPHGQVTNDPVVNIFWEIEKGNQSSFVVYNGSGSVIDCFDGSDSSVVINHAAGYSNGTTNFTQTGEGVHEYKVTTYEDPLCEPEQSDKSDPAYITIDTTPPTLPSKFPAGDNVAVDSNVVMGFSDNNSLNTGYIENNFSISPSVTGGFTWSGGDELTYNHTGLNHGTEYSVSVQPKDEAGNTGDEYQWSFTTSVKPENLEIQNPSEGDSLIAGNNIDIQASVTGANDTAVQGASVQTSGACSTTLTEQGSGTYTGSCAPSQIGNKTLTFTASNAGQTAENNITLTIVEEKTLSINIIEPEERSYQRGSTINFKTQPIVEGSPYGNASITSPDLSFNSAENNTYTATLDTGYTDTGKNIQIQASGTVQGTSKTTTNTVSIDLTPITLDTEIEYLVNGEPVQTLGPGDTMRVKATVSYPDGEPVTDAEIQGTLTETTEIGQETSTLNFTHEGNGEYTTEKKHAVTKHITKYRTGLTIEDQIEPPNTYTGNQSIPGPVGGLKLHILQPEEIKPTEVKPLEASPGQTLIIQGKVKRKQETVTPDTVELDGEKFQRQGETYTINYTIPNTDQDSIEINLKITKDETTYTQTQEIDLTPPQTTLNTPQLKQQGITRGQRFTAQITYPNQDSLKQGNITAVIGEENYTMQYNQETGKWQTTEPIDLGEEEKTIAITVKGQDQNGNQVKEAEETGIKYNPALTIIDQLKNPIVIGTIAAALAATLTGFWWYFYRYKGKKKFQEKITELKETFKEMDNAYRSFSKTHNSDKLSSRQGDIESQQQSIKHEIIDLVQKHRSLEKHQLKAAEKIAEESIKKLLPYYKEGAAGRRVWLTGVGNFEAHKILTLVKDKYADKIQELKEKDKTNEEIKEELTEKHGFKENKAEDIIEYQEERSKLIEKARNKLEEGKQNSEIIKDLKNNIKPGKEQFKEYRAKQIIKKAGGNIEIKEPETKKPKKTKEIKKKEKPEQSEKTKKKQEEKEQTKKPKQEPKKETYKHQKSPEVQRLKKIMEELQEMGRSKQQIKKDIKEQAEEIGLPEKKIDRLLKELED